MLVVGMDLESTGLDVTEARIIEIGAVLWDTERHAPLKILSVLVDPGVGISEEITRVTGIKPGDVGRWGLTPGEAFDEFFSFVAGTEAEAFVGHNSTAFDKPLLENELKRHDFIELSLPWIDTSMDVPYPESIKTRKLTHLAAEHGFLNPWAHRAIFDVMTMLRVFSHYDAAAVLARSELPSVTLEAITTKPWEDTAPAGEKQTDKARARGFRWDGARKKWVKTVKQPDVASESSHGEFAVRVLEG